MGNPSCWDIVLEREVPAHVHTCPVCDAHFPCLLECDLHPDHDLVDGTPGGAYLCCSASCAADNDDLIRDAYGSGWRPTAYRSLNEEPLGG